MKLYIQIAILSISNAKAILRVLEPKAINQYFLQAHYFMRESIFDNNSTSFILSKKKLIL